MVALLLASACVDRPDAAKTHPNRAAPSAAPPVTAPTVDTPRPTAPTVAEPAEAARGMGAPTLPSTSAAANADFRDVTGPALLAEVRRSGKQGVLVNVWASWCAPCRRELPMFQNLATNYEPRGIGVWFVSVDDAPDKPTALQILKESGIAPPTFWAAGDLEPFKRALNPRWPGMIPATFLFDASGKLRYFWGGPVYEEEIVPIVEGFLAGEPIDGEADFTLSPGKVLR